MQPLPQSLARSTPSATPVPAAGDGPPVMEMEGVWRRYDDLVAVRDVSLTISEGTILGLIGPSGSGKTTIIRMLSGTLGPSEGWLKVLGQVPLRFTREARERIAYMPQLFSLYPDLTASENVNFVSALFGVPWWGRSKLIKRSLSVVDLWEARNRPARDLSGALALGPLLLGPPGVIAGVVEDADFDEMAGTIALAALMAAPAGT